MIYYRIVNERIEKYEVKVDIEKLKKLREEIKYSCSRRKHRTTTGTRFWNNDEFVINFHSKPIGWIEYNDGPDERNYEYTYDELIPPKLIKIIDGILKGSISSLIELFTSDESKDEVNFEEEINLQLKTIESISDTDIDKKIKALEELKKIYSNQKENKSIKKVSEYYDKVKDLIIFNKLGSVSLKQTQNILSFFGMCMPVSYTESEKCDIIKLVKERR